MSLLHIFLLNKSLHLARQCGTKNCEFLPSSLVIGALAHRSEAEVNFYCNVNDAPPQCLAIVDTGETFNFDQSQECTEDRNFCSQLTATYKNPWKISMENQSVCDNTGVCLTRFCTADCIWFSNQIPTTCGAATC